MPKGTTVVLMPIVTHYDEASWGFDANVFDPERFLDPTRAKKAFLPFGGGPRICIGLALANLETKVLVGEIAAAFRLAPEMKEGPKDYDRGGIMRNLEPLVVESTPRDPSLPNRN